MPWRSGEWTFVIFVSISRVSKVIITHTLNCYPRKLLCLQLLQSVVKTKFCFPSLPESKQFFLYSKTPHFKNSPWKQTSWSNFETQESRAKNAVEKTVCGTNVLCIIPRWLLSRQGFYDFLYFSTNFPTQKYIWHEFVQLHCQLAPIICILQMQTKVWETNGQQKFNYS